MDIHGSVFFDVIPATRIAGLLRLMRSGETTSAGPSPPCSDPRTGSSITRNIAPAERAFKGHATFPHPLHSTPQRSPGKCHSSPGNLPEPPISSPPGAFHPASFGSVGIRPCFALRAPSGSQTRWLYVGHQVGTLGHTNHHIMPSRGRLDCSCRRSL